MKLGNVFFQRLSDITNERSKRENMDYPIHPLDHGIKKFTGFIGIFFEFSTNINSNPKPITVGI